MQYTLAWTVISCCHIEKAITIKPHLLCLKLPQIKCFYKTLQAFHNLQKNCNQLYTLSIASKCINHEISNKTENFD